MFFRCRPVPVLLALFALSLAACRGGSGDSAPPASVKSIDDYFPIKIGDQVVRMQIAALAAEQQKGLMFRSSMAEDEGMLFVFTEGRPQSFYMRNTEIPLDIGFIDPSGELKEIYPMYPRDERTVASRSHAIQFCLEMNQGWFKRHEVRPGAKLDLKAVSAAITARGFRPELAGLPK